MDRHHKVSTPVPMRCVFSQNLLPPVGRHKHVKHAKKMAHLALLHVREELAFLLVVAALAVLVAVAAALALLQRRLGLPALLLLLSGQPCAPPGLNGPALRPTGPEWSALRPHRASMVSPAPHQASMLRSHKLAHTVGQSPLYFWHTTCSSSVVDHAHPVTTAFLPRSALRSWSNLCSASSILDSATLRAVLYRQGAAHP